MPDKKKRTLSSFPYTSANHFKFGYKNRTTFATRWLEKRESAQEEFVAKYGRAEIQHASWRNANVSAAREILALAFKENLTPVICFSGGLDSEIAISAFFDACHGLPQNSRPTIEIATMHFSGGENRHDTAYVEKCLARLRRSGHFPALRRYTLNVEKFFSSEEFQTIAFEFQVVSPAVICQIWLCEQIRLDQSVADAGNVGSAGALPIVAQGEMYLAREEDPSNNYAPAPWQIVETENLCGLYRYFISHGTPGVPGFFQYLPEQFEAQLRLNPVIHELISHSRFGKLGTRSSKADILAHDYPELEARPKFTGFENIEALYNERRAFLLSRLSECTGQWRQDVLSLMADLRPIKPGPLRYRDWSAAWGRDGEIHSQRTSADDVFATEWASPELLREAFQRSEISEATAQDEFLSALSDYLSGQLSGEQATSIALDGSHMSRIFQCVTRKILKDQAVKHRLEIFSASDFMVPKPNEIARLVLQTGFNDAETLARAIPLTTSKLNELFLIHPLLHTKILNAEFDRGLESTLAEPRFVWTEFELLASVMNASEIVAPGRASFPWTDSKLASAKIIATRATGWFDRDEPGADNWKDFIRFLESCLVRLDESEQERKLAREHERAYSEFKKQIADALARCSFARVPYQISAYSLPDYSTAVPDLKSVFLTAPSPLRVVPTSTWLRNAQSSVPMLRLGANLFYQQKISGLSLLSSETRVSVALVDEASGEEVCWAQVLILSSSKGKVTRFRLRGITTRPDFRRRGIASNLLRLVTGHLREVVKARHPAVNPSASVDVFAAPEVVGAFRLAGFVDDVKRNNRNAEILNPATARLESVDYELTALTLLLGET